MTRVIRFVGDIHGKVNAYKRVIEGTEESIQVGDFGIGFGPRSTALIADTSLDTIEGNHRFIRGNHDNPAECKRSSHFIKDGTADGNMMFVGGALSIDKAFRDEGVDWWPDEELSLLMLGVMADIYTLLQPEIMITHDCPESIAKDIMIPLVKGFDNFPSRTRQAFDVMFQEHQPKLWIWGHWHHPLDTIINGTRCICLPELGYIDIDVESL